MKRTLVLFLVCFSAAASAQQFPFEFWHEGKIVLETSDTLRGLVKYDLQNDLLQLKIKNQLESYTARKVLFFEIFDQSAKRYRQFYSLPYSQNNTYNTPTFFELVAEGKLTVLTREKLEYRTVSTGFYYYGNYTRLVLVNTYFLLKPNGKIEQINNPRRRDWLDLMKNKEDDVMAFAKENRLDFDDKFELTRIIEYYNSL
ncbi:MAG: hypothetical protein ACK5BJ_11160 [Bacteroidota bacterium]|jgi:hypothetical protein|nr:hypothetical protein [Flammeovirgaceae bacterium]MCZ8071216.1 hypothetical protein [Cytophagales bacterium]